MEVYPWAPSACEAAGGALSHVVWPRAPDDSISSGRSCKGSVMGVIGEERGSMSGHFARRHTVGTPCAPDRVQGKGKSRDEVARTLFWDA